MANILGSQWQGRSQMAESELEIFRKIESVLMGANLSPQECVVTLLNALAVVIDNNFDHGLADKFASYVELFMSDVNGQKPC